MSSLADLNKLVEELAIRQSKRKAYKKESEETLSYMYKPIRDLELAILNILESHDLRKFVSPIAKVEVRDKLSFQTPKSPEDRKAFMEYIKQLNDDPNNPVGAEELELRALGYFSVNSRTLNSFAQKEIARRESEGNLDRSIPGLEEPNEYTELAIGKA